MAHKPSNRQIKATNNENSENPTLYSPYSWVKALSSLRQIKAIANTECVR